MTFKCISACPNLWKIQPFQLSYDNNY